MLRAADLTPELVDAATEALLMSHRKFSETRLEAMRFTQRSLHMKDEKESRKRAIADTIVRFQSLGLGVALYDAGRAGTERERRARCLRALLDDVVSDQQTRVLLDRDESLVSWDRQTLLDLTSSGGSRDRISYAHVSRHQEPLLILPDAVAWCWAKGGHWRQRVRPIVIAVREV